MIPNAILTIAYSILNWLIELLPASTGWPTEAHAAMSGLGGYMGVWSPVLPLTTLATVITVIFSVEIGIFGFKTVKWVMSHIPFIGGRG